MTHDTSKKPSDIVSEFCETSLPVRGRFVRTITRADGSVDRKVINNIVTADGLNLLAERAISDTASKAGWLAVGTATHTPHINSQEILEADRKAAAVINSSKEVFYAIATWGGNADSVTSVQLESAAICNHQTSGSGVYINHAGGLSTVLGDSDFLHLEVQVQVGSHAI